MKQIKNLDLSNKKTFIVYTCGSHYKKYEAEAEEILKTNKKAIVKIYSLKYSIDLS